MNAGPPTSEPGPAAPLSHGLAGFDAALRLVENVSLAIASVCMGVVVVVASVDVAGRYLFNAPLMWSYLLISQYLMAAVFFLAIGATQRRGQNIAIDLVVRHFSPRGRSVAMSLWLVAATVFFLVATYAGYGILREALRRGDLTAGIFVWPLWPAYLLVPIGFAIVFLRLLVSLYLSVGAALAGAAPPGEDRPAQTTRYE